jgi:hypothetical protein
MPASLILYDLVGLLTTVPEVPKEPESAAVAEDELAENCHEN